MDEDEVHEASTRLARPGDTSWMKARIGVLRTATSTSATPPYALGYLDIGTKGYHPLEQLVDFLYSQRVRDATPSTTLPLSLWGDVSLSAAIFFSLTIRGARVVCAATATTAGRC